MRTTYGTVLLSVIVGAMAHEQFLLLRRRRGATVTTTTQQKGSEPRNVMHIEEGDVASFTCAAASHEPMRVEWRHNGSLVQHPPPGDERNSSLRVWHAPPDDALGTLTRSSHLVVQPKTPTSTESKGSQCRPDRQCSDIRKLCDGGGPCQCPDGSMVSKEGECPAAYKGPHLASILAWVSSVAAAAVLLAALAVLTMRRIRRTPGSTLLKSTQDDDGLEELDVSRRNSFITTTLPASSEQA
ncbi:hypothetical protein MRX96_052101 [Rhipicephalus microplus]